ncbi:MAG TPA: fatty acid cis/trans isomerase, partial [Solirubrobacterales bacterium]|nr:fatty acid cis/trans isomerase [Solirubrobacterales bacterium]
MALPDHSLSRRRGVDLLLIAAAVAALAACTTDVSSQEGSTEPNPNERSASPAADYSILRPGNRYAADVGDRYLDEIQPTLASRCAVCHSCTNGPCQLNMTSFAALQRGIHSKNPYKWGLTDNLQTRVSDNRPLSEWRAKGFKSVLPDGGDPESSIFWKALELGDQNTSSPDPNQGPLATSQVRRLAQDHDAGNYSCPSNSFEWWLFTWKYPQGGMPWGLPTDADAHATLEEWTLDGAPGPSAAAQRTVSSPQRTVMTQMDPDALVATWDAFLDGSDLRSKLVARYIFEHAYSANIHFDENPGEFYRIVRSRTA